MSVESVLREKLKAIFDVKRCTLNAEAPDAVEQETLFVRVESSRGVIKDGRELYRVIGQAFVFGQADKFPIGYFPKRIKDASPADSTAFFFYDIEETTGVYQNLVRRSFSFIYFFDGQYDPDNGTITTLNLSEGET